MPSLEMQKTQNPSGGWESGRMFGYEPAQGWLRCGGLGRGGTFPCVLSSPEGPRTVPHGGSSGPGCWMGEKAAQLPIVLASSPVLPDRAAASTWHTAREPDLHPCTTGWTWSLLTLHVGVSWCWTPVLACPAMTHGPHNRAHRARHPQGTSATQRNQAKHTDSRTLLPSPRHPQIDESRKRLQRQDPGPQGTPPGQAGGSEASREVCVEVWLGKGPQWQGGLDSPQLGPLLLWLVPHRGA